MSYTVRLLANAQRDLADIEAYFDAHVPHETERCLDAIESARHAAEARSIGP